MAPQVLMIDDEKELAEATAEYLTLCGIESTYAESAAQAREMLAADPPQVILLDINMPGESGFQFCREIREHSQVPIVFVSARESDSDQILALSLGGDDYVRKPFSMAVLLAKLRRMIERTAGWGAAAPSQAARTGFQDERLTIDLAASRVWVDGQEVQIPGTEYRLLSYLVENRGRVVPKTELLDRLWNTSFVSEGALSVQIRRVRTRLEPDPDNPIYIRTVWGRGYMFERADT